jgi:hypothetical protein
MKWTGCDTIGKKKLYKTVAGKFKRMGLRARFIDGQMDHRKICKDVNWIQLVLCRVQEYRCMIL